MIYLIALTHTHVATNLQCLITSLPTHKTNTDTNNIHLVLKSSHVHEQYKPTLPHHTNNKNQSTKITHNNTTQRPGQASHKIHHKHNQTSSLKPQHVTSSTLDKATVSHPKPQLFHKQINPAVMNLCIQHCNQSIYKICGQPSSTFCCCSPYTTDLSRRCSLHFNFYFILIFSSLYSILLLLLYLQTPFPIPPLPPPACVAYIAHPHMILVITDTIRI